MSIGLTTTIIAASLAAVLTICWLLWRVGLMRNELQALKQQHPRTTSPDSKIGDIKPCLPAPPLVATDSFRYLMDMAPTAVIIADTSTSDILFANPEAAALIGQQQALLIGQPITSLYVTPSQRAELVARLKDGELINGQELQLCRSDNSPMWVRVSSRISSYEGHEATISVWDDITDRRLGEIKLRESENTLRLALASAPFPLIVASSFDRSARMINQRAKEALKITENECAAPPITDDFLDAAVRAEIGQMLSGHHEITDREALIRPRTGPRFWALVSARTINFKGESAFILSFTDISEHKRIEREMAENRTTLRSMINASPIWMAMLDRSGYYLLVNRPFEELIDRSASGIEGRHFTEVLPRPFTTRHSNFINRCIEGEIVEFEEDLENLTSLSGATNKTTRAHGKYSPVIAKDGTISGCVLAMIDITERHIAEEKLKAQLNEINRLHLLLKEQVVRDPLTGLFNRRYLDETLDRELARARREGYPVCVIMLDIDHFKRLNDTYGHQAGDQVLKTLAALLSDNMREGDMPCRYGGEEFTMALPNATAAIARERAEEWRKKFEALSTRFGHFELKSTISLGIAAYPEHGKTRDELIQAADTALYVSKKTGRNTTRVHSSTDPGAENMISTCSADD